MHRLACGVGFQPVGLEAYEGLGVERHCPSTRTIKGNALLRLTLRGLRDALATTTVKAGINAKAVAA